MISKLRSFCFLAAAFLLLGVGVYGQENNSKPRYNGSIRGETYAYKYTEQDFAATPSWNGEDGEPPISLPQALQIARTNLPRFVEDARVFKMRSATLRIAGGNDKWFYTVLFSCSGSGCRNLETKSFQIIVKMDGTILEPKKVVTIG